MAVSSGRELGHHLSSVASAAEWLASSRPGTGQIAIFRECFAAVVELHRIHDVWRRRREAARFERDVLALLQQRGLDGVLTVSFAFKEAGSAEITPPPDFVVE